MPGLCQAIDLEATVRLEHRPGVFSAGARVFGVDLKAADFSGSLMRAGMQRADQLLFDFCIFSDFL